MLPFVQVYSWWANGIAGTIPSALAYLASCARHLPPRAPLALSPPPAALALAFFALNPNLLYLQTTAMTEPLFRLRNDLDRRLARRVALSAR